MPLSAIKTAAAPAAIGPYSQAIRAGDLLFCAGQIALDPATGQIVGAGDITRETRQVLANLGAVLAAGGASFAQVVRTTIYLRDLGDYATVNALYGEVVAVPAPARVLVEVSRLPREARVEIDAIAYLA